MGFRWSAVQIRPPRLLVVRKLRMRARKIPIIVMSLLALLSASCIWTGKSEGISLALLGRVPRETSFFVFWDISTLRDRAALGNIYNSWIDKEREQLEKFGIDYTCVNYFAWADDGEGRMEIVEGDFDVEGITGRLIDLGYTRQSYPPPSPGVEMWVGPTEEDETVAMIEGTIFVGGKESLERCIGVYRGEEESLQDDQYIKLITDRLPGGIMVMIRKAGEFPQYPLLLASGMVYKIRDEDILEVRAVYVFDGKGAAEEALADIGKRWASEKYYWDPMTSQRDEFVESRALIRSLNLSYF